MNAVSELYEIEQAPQPGGLKIEAVRNDGKVVLSLVGELDLVSASDLERELKAAQTGDTGGVVIDLAGLEFIDSTGLRVLLGAWLRSADGAPPLQFRNAQSQVRRLFEVAGVLERFSLDGN